MKLHSPRFEKVLRKEVKKAVRSSPVLKKEYRQANKAARRRRGPAWVWLVISLGAGGATWLFVRVTGHPATGLAAINLMTLYLAAVYARSLPMTLYRASDLPALFLLPVPESQVFRWELQKFFRNSAVFSLTAMLAAYSGLGVCLRLSIAHWLATIALALVSWVTLLALAAFFAARFPRLRYDVFTSAVFTFFLVLLMTWKMLGAEVLRFIDHIAPTLNLILPTGWCPSLFQLLLPSPQWIVALLIIPIPVVIWTVKSSLELLENRFKYMEPITPEIPDQLPGESRDAAEENDRPVRARPARLGPTAIEEIVQTRQIFLTNPWERRGWFERTLWQWLDLRERALAEFAFPNGISITKPWIVFLRNFSVMILIGFAAGLADARLEPWVIGIGLFFTTVHALALIWGNGSAFRAMSSSGVHIHLYAAYPITFRELSNLLFKVSAIQLPLFTAYALVCAVLICYLTVTPFAIGLIAAFRLGLLVFSARFITTTLAFSACSNDTAKFRLRTIVLILAIIGSGLIFLCLGAGSLFVPGPIAWILWVAAIADAYTFFRIYGWFHSTNKFDLMAVPRR